MTQRGAVRRDRPSARLASDTGASWVGIAGIAAVVALILGGGVVLVMLVVSSLSSPAAPVAATPTAGVCSGNTWFDPATASCVPREACRPGEIYDQATNTCELPGPTITGIDPNSGLSTGGTPIRVTGEDFEDGATITIDGVPATDVVVVSPTTITATTPGSENLYPVDVVVANRTGPSSMLDNAFTYVRPPVERLTKVTPPRGSDSGGEAVIINGRGFVEGTKVAFGGRAAPSVQVLNEETLRVITPIGQRGPVTVNIDIPGEDTYAAQEAFTYTRAVPRVVMAIRPQRGGTAGGTEITIVGTGFDPKAAVAIGGKPARKVEVVSDTRITAVTPKGKLGPANVAVRNPGLPAAILEDGFEYVEAPAIETVEPAEGSVDGGTKVTIVGTGFLADAEVTFDGVPATDVKVADETRITAVTPEHAKGKVDVVVTNPEQPAATAKKAFTYVPADKTDEPVDEPVVRLPRCTPVTPAAAVGSPGSPLTLIAADLFGARSGVTKPRLLSATLVPGVSDDAGDLAWQSSPPRIVWLTPDEPGVGATITFRYEAGSCRGSSTGTVAVSTG